VGLGDRPRRRLSPDACQRRAVPLAGKSYVWPKEEIDAWLENKGAARNEAIARETMARNEAIARIPS
jgi:hypothetical protein